MSDHSDVNPTRAGDIGRWDRQADLVVSGYGIDENVMSLLYRRVPARAGDRPAGRERESKATSGDLMSAP